MNNPLTFLIVCLACALSVGDPYSISVKNVHKSENLFYLCTDGFHFFCFPYCLKL